ncbi:MAG: Phosphoheptose isomerase [Candidatus Anoxychlamydiales bacterium]|nr:Phosphoheptose isomerase [Candidatus Anoxychlamydiales bacterium]
MKNLIFKETLQAIEAINKLKEEKALNFMQKAAEMITNCFNSNGKIIIAGNGGSMCDSTHFAEEFTGFFRRRDRKPLPAIALCEAGHLTCVSNDQGFDYVFSRPVEALMNENDIFIALTTSGNSNNLINAVKAAREKKGRVISFLGKTGGLLKGLSDIEWIVDGFETSDRIQEAHMAAAHIIIEAVEQAIYSPKKILESLKEKACL